MTVAEFSVLLFVFKERLIERKVTAATVVLYLFDNLSKSIVFSAHKAAPQAT